MLYDYEKSKNVLNDFFESVKYNIRYKFNDITQSLHLKFIKDFIDKNINGLTIGRFQNFMKII